MVHRRLLTQSEMNHAIKDLCYDKSGNEYKKCAKTIRSEIRKIERYRRKKLQGKR